MHREGSQPRTRRNGGNTRSHGLLLLSAALAGCTPLPPPPAPAAEVRVRNEQAAAAPYGRVIGTVRSRATGQPLKTQSPLVVFVLAPCNKTATGLSASVISHGNGKSSPSFLVVAAGTRVSFTNQDRIFHRFFSSSANQVFDTGLLAPGSSSAVGLDRAGAVNVYCSLHEGRQATILVTPTSQSAVVGPRGEF